MSLQKLNKLIDDVKKDENNLQILIDCKDEFTQEDWDDVTENYEDIPEIVSNAFIIRKENLETEIGMDLMINLYNQHYPEEFYAQPYIKELLDMDEDEYDDIMDSVGSSDCGDIWKKLFRCKQHYFSEKFIMENAEHIIGNYSLQRYQSVPIEFYEKYIDDERLKHVAIGDQDIPATFIKKNIKKHHEKLGITNIMNVNGLTEELFIEFLSYKELSSEECRNALWLSVGAYKISEQFIRSNLDKINREYHDIFITNQYECPWDLIVQNGVDYSEELIHENIKHINLSLVFNPWSILECDKKQYSPDFIKKYWNHKDVDIAYVMAQDSLEEMNDFLEKLLEEKKIKPSLINRFENISLVLIEKYRSELDFERVCYHNKNITIPFFVDKIMKWYPELRLGVTTYLCIENASENNLLFFINDFHKNYDEDEILLFFKLAADIINNCPDKYSDHIKDIVLNKNIPNNIIPKSDVTKLASLDDADVMFRFFLHHILSRMDK